MSKRAKARGTLLDIPGFMMSVGQKVAIGLGAKPSDVDLSPARHDTVEIDTADKHYRLRFSVSQLKSEGPVLRVSCTAKKWTGRGKPLLRTVKQPLFIGAKIAASDLSDAILLKL